MNEVLAQAAKTGNVKILAIVDDAYDPPQTNEILENAFNQFVQALEEDQTTDSFLRDAGGVTDFDVDDWEHFVGNERLIRALWGLYVGTDPNRSVSEEAQAILEKLFADVQLDRLSKLTGLKALEDILDGIGGTVMRLGSNPDAALVAKADVVFLDLYLSDQLPSEADVANPSPRSMYDRARDRAIECLRSVRAVTANDLKAVAPAFILISSQGTDRIAENFRKRAGQMRSRFRFVSKQAIAEGQPHGLLAIADILRACAACAMVEPIRKAWPKVLDKARAWVEERIIDLDISDFGRLYHFRLEKEGQPIEEYVKDLIAGALAERVLCEFSELGLPVTTENPFKSVPHYFEAPSNGFAELYSATRISRDPGNSPTFPQSGDLYVEGRLSKAGGSLNDRKVIAVMSPPCDLIDRDGKGPATQSALLLEGTIRPVTYKHEREPQMIAVGARYYEIDWALKHPHAIKIDVLRHRKRRKRITWLGRLKGEHFLSLQAEYLSGLGRIGLIKSPGVFETLAGDISVKEGGARRKVGSPFAGVDRFAYICADQRKSFENQPIVFTGSFLQFFLDLLIRTQSDADLTPIIRGKAKGVIERMEQVLHLIESRNAKGHTIQNYMTVELHESNRQEIVEPANGVFVIRLWKD